MKSALLLAVVALSGVVLAQRGERDNTIRECFGKVADIFFLLDSSSSIWEEDYDRVLQFVSQVITRFDVSRDGTRIGALTFSDDFQVGFDLQRYRSKGEVLAAVEKRVLPYRTGMTNTDQAIRRVRSDVNFRQDITKVMVVLTDGGSRDQGQTRREADLARDAGFHMVVVGMGQYQDEAEWRNIASDPDNDYIFNITNYELLGNLRDSLPRRVCLMPPIILGSDCRVRQNTDVLVVAGPDGFFDAMDVAGDLAQRISPQDRMRGAYIMDGCQDTVDVEFEGPERFCQRQGDALPRGQDAYTSLVERLRRTAQEMKSSRLGVRQIAVLFIDDLTLNNENRIAIIQEVRNAQQFDGLDIIVVDVNVRQYRNFLVSMTQNVRENVIDFQRLGLTQSVQQVLDRVCYYANYDFGDVIPS